MDQSLVDSANQLVDGIKIELLDNPDGTFSVKTPKFAVHVINVLWNMIGGYKFDPNDVLIKRNMECCDKLVEILGHDNPYNLFPFLRTWFPNQMRLQEHLQIHEEIHVFTKVSLYLIG